VPEESTTPDAVELARRFFAAVNRRDVDAVENFYAPDAVLRGAEIGTIVGPAAIRSFFEDMLSRYDEFHGELEEISALGNGVGFLVTVCVARPVGSDEELQLRLASVLVGTESVIEQQTNYIDIDEGRAAAERLAAERE
jgi:ketosteroid isomerase-like protein